MADTLDVLSLAEGQTAINNAAADATELALKITAVSRILDAECGPIVQRTVTDELQDGGCGDVWLNLRPVASVTTLTEYNTGTALVLTAETVTSLPADGYSLEVYEPNPALFSGQIYRRSSGADAPFPSGRRNVKITYVAGRAANTAAVDPRFKSCAASILRRLWKRESGTWAQSSDFFEQIDSGGGAPIGFFRVAKPLIDDMLRDEVQTIPGVG